MPSEPGTPTSYPASLDQGVADSFGDGRADFALKDHALDLLAMYFPSESEASDSTNETFATVKPAVVKTETAELTALPLRGHFHQTELAITQSVADADAFKTELAQLRELATKLTTELTQIENATHVVEQRSVAATTAQSIAVTDLREQLQQTALEIKQSAGSADTFRTELAQLRDVGAQLTAEYSQILNATRVVEQRSVAATTAQSIAVTDLREQLYQTDLTIKQSAGDADAYKTELAQLREAVARLSGEHCRIEEATYALEKRSAEALEIVNMRLADLNALVDRVMRQAEALESQEVRINSVLEKGNGIDEIVAAMEARIAKLKKANQLIEPSEGTTGPVEQLAKSASQLAQVTTIENEVGPDLRVPALSTLRKTSRLIWRHGDMIGGLAVVILAALLIARSFGTAVKLDRQPAPTDAEPVLVLSTRVLPWMMLTPAVPILPRTMLGSAQPLPQQQPSPAPPPPVDAASKETQARSSNFMGTLEIQSEPPGASVFIDRERVGETPLQVADLRAGSHVIWVERDGYERWTAAVRMVAGEVTRVDVTLQTEPARPGINNER